MLNDVMSRSGLRFLLLFSSGLISSFGFLLLSVIIDFFLPLPYEYIGQAETYYEHRSAPFFSIAVVLGSLFGIWVILKILREKTNYFYLIIIAAIFLTLQFFVSKIVSKEITTQFNEVSLFGVPLILAIMANKFSPKRVK